MGDNIYTIRAITRYFIVAVLFLDISYARILFLPKDELIGKSEYIVVARVESTADTGRKELHYSVKANVVENRLKPLEIIKGSFSINKKFVINTLKYDGWMEDNVKLPPIGKDVLLFLKMNKEGELVPVNGIQGVWYLQNGEPSRIGRGTTTLKQIREMVKKQALKSCNSKVFTSLLDRAEKQTQAGDYKKALETYRKAYAICPMKDIEEMMAWLMGEVGDEGDNL